MQEDQSTNNGKEYILLIPEIARMAGVHPEIVRVLARAKHLPTPIQVGEFRKMKGVPWCPKAEGYWSRQVPEVLEKIAALKPRRGRPRSKKAESQ